MDVESKLLIEREKLEKQAINSACLFNNKVLKQSQKVDKLIVSAIKEKLMPQ